MLKTFNVKPYSIVIIVVFLSTIIFPLIFSDKAGGTISLRENRYLATFPNILTKDKKIAPGVRVGLENWINDNVGGRGLAFYIHDFLLYKVFDIIPEVDVVEGKENWLYLIYDFGISECVNTNIPSQEYINYLKTNLDKLTQDLKKENIEFLVMLYPPKCNVYPEYLPSNLRLVTTESALDILDKQLSGYSLFDLKTAIKPLKRGKENRLVYYKAYDRSHWNQYGAFIGYTSLMQQVKNHIPNIRLLTEKDFHISSVQRDIATAWGFHTQEEDLQYSLKGGYHAILDNSFFNTFNFISKDPWQSYRYFKNPNETLPKTVIVGDSFTWMFLLPNLSESFTELAFIHYLDVDYLSEIIHRIEPDIVIFTGLGASSVEYIASYTYGPPE